MSIPTGVQMTSSSCTNARGGQCVAFRREVTGAERGWYTDGELACEPPGVLHTPSWNLPLLMRRRRNFSAVLPQSTMLAST